MKKGLIIGGAAVAVVGLLAFGIYKALKYVERLNLNLDFEDDDFITEPDVIVVE